MSKTSITHPLRIDELFVNGKSGILGMTFCPGKKDKYGMTGAWDRDLDIDIESIKKWGATRFVCLLESKEFSLLGVPELSQTVQESPMKWYHLPIVDTEVPDNAFENKWATVGLELREALVNGEKILLHCRGGLGRTGTIAAKILIEHGYAHDEAIRAVRKARSGTIENKLQEDYVISCYVCGTE